MGLGTGNLKTPNEGTNPSIVTVPGSCCFHKWQHCLRITHSTVPCYSSYNIPVFQVSTSPSLVMYVCVCMGHLRFWLDVPSYSAYLKDYRKYGLNYALNQATGLRSSSRTRSFKFICLGFRPHCNWRSSRKLTLSDPVESSLLEENFFFFFLSFFLSFFVFFGSFSCRIFWAMETWRPSAPHIDLSWKQHPSIFTPSIPCNLPTLNLATFCLEVKRKPQRVNVNFSKLQVR